MVPSIEGIESLHALAGLEWLAAIGLLHFVLPLAVVFLTISRARVARRKERLANAQWVPDTPLREGSAVLHGAVEYANGARAALAVEILQTGTEYKGKKESWSHRWTEVDRTVRATPFYVRDVRGTRVRVEPDGRTMLIDDVDRVEPVGPTTRRRIAELTPDETVFVVGQLEPALDPEAPGGYREAGKALVLRPPRGGRMLVSTEPLHERFRKAATTERSATRLFGGVLIALALLDAPFYLRLFAGDHAHGLVVAKSPISGKNSRCELTVESDEGWTFKDDTTWSTCSSVSTKITRVPFLRVHGISWFAQIGTEPGVHSGAFTVGAIVFAFLALLYRNRARPWYEDKLVDSGSGRLRA